MFKLLRILSKRKARYSYYDCRCASGGVTYKPMMSKEEASEIVEEVIELLQEKERLLPGGYLFLIRFSW